MIVIVIVIVIVNMFYSVQSILMAVRTRLHIELEGLLVEASHRSMLSVSRAILGRVSASLRCWKVLRAVNRSFAEMGTQELGSSAGGKMQCNKSIPP